MARLSALNRSGLKRTSSTTQRNRAQLIHDVGSPALNRTGHISQNIEKRPEKAVRKAGRQRHLHVCSTGPGDSRERSFGLEGILKGFEVGELSGAT